MNSDIIVWILNRFKFELLGTKVKENPDGKNSQILTQHQLSTNRGMMRFPEC
jgi:hypothetical protein